MSIEMTDAGVVCSFMEKQPADMERGERGPSEGGWWKYRWSVLSQKFRTCPNSDKTDSLDALHEVEARLTADQWRVYAALIFHRCCTEARTFNPIEDLLTVNRKGMIHASAEQKIKALATVLRPEVERG